MKRFHTSLSVSDLARSVEFYARLFGVEPTVRKPDYAKWMLEDPRINFSLTTRGVAKGISHIGWQLSEQSELDEIRGRLSGADPDRYDEEDVGCCYARSNKTWLRDPDGVSWENFLTHGEIDEYGDGDQDHDRGEAAGLTGVPAPDKSAATTGVVCCGFD